MNDAENEEKRQLMCSRCGSLLKDEGHGLYCAVCDLPLCPYCLDPVDMEEDWNWTACVHYLLTYTDGPLELLDTSPAFLERLNWSAEMTDGQNIFLRAIGDDEMQERFGPFAVVWEGDFVDDLLDATKIAHLTFDYNDALGAVHYFAAQGREQTWRQLDEAVELLDAGIKWLRDMVPDASRAPDSTSI